MKTRGPLLEIIKSHRLFGMVCGGLLLANLLFYLFFVTTESRNTARLQTRFQTERKQVSELRKHAAAVDHFQALQASWKAFEDHLPGKTASPERIDQLKRMLGRYNLRTADLAFRSEPVTGSALVRFTTTLQTSGAYGDLKQFIGSLQAMPGLFCIHQLELRKPENGGPLDMTMELSAYFSERK